MARDSILPPGGATAMIRVNTQGLQEFSRYNKRTCNMTQSYKPHYSDKAQSTGECLSYMTCNNIDVLAYYGPETLFYTNMFNK